MAPFANSSTRRLEFRLGSRRLEPLNRRSLLPTPLPTRLSRSVTDVLERDNRARPSTARYFTLLVTCCSLGRS